MQTFALKVKFMLTKINVKIKNLIYSLVCVLYRMEKRSFRTFDKYMLPKWKYMFDRVVQVWAFFKGTYLFGAALSVS